MKRFTVLTLCLFSTVAVSLAKEILNDCVRPWQQPIMTRALIGFPSQPESCHPEGKRCPDGRNSQCQFSFRRFKYVCCEDKQGEKPPECPRYHDTLLTICDNSESSCPRGYKCMGSRLDESLKLCCKSNHNLKYPEPDTTFRDRHIVPEYMPMSPQYKAEISFDNRSVIISELFSSHDLPFLSNPPQIMTQGLNDDKEYTVVLFDISVPNPVSIHWLTVNVPSVDNQLALNNKLKTVVPYHSPDVSDEPQGMHILVLAVFEQQSTWPVKQLNKFDPTEVNMVHWLSESADIIGQQPISGMFYAYSTSSTMLQNW